VRARGADLSRKRKTGEREGGKKKGGSLLIGVASADRSGSPSVARVLFGKKIKRFDCKSARA